MNTIITSLLTFLCTLITCIFTQNKTIGIIEERIKNINNKLNDLTENGDLVDINLHKRNLELVENFYKTMTSTPSNCKVFKKEITNEISSE